MAGDAALDKIKDYVEHVVRGRAAELAEDARGAALV